MNREDADRAIEVYNNRQLDGQAMKCQLVKIGSSPKSHSDHRLSLPAQSSRQRYKNFLELLIFKNKLLIPVHCVQIDKK